MGPVRLREVEAAQMRIVEVIKRLEENQEIVIAGRGGEEDIVY
jgi:flagellar motor switch protein FliG